MDVKRGFQWIHSVLFCLIRFGSASVVLMWESSLFVRRLLFVLLGYNFLLLLR